MGAKVTVISSGISEVHMGGGAGDYITACGLDGADNDPSVQQEIVPTSRGAKINCQQCRQIWETARRYRAWEFEDATHG